jgi:predicted membrane protein (TIGR00267 family)
LGNENGIVGRIRDIIEHPGTGPTLRRFFVTTVFDSTFVILGIIIGSALSHEPNRNIIITTILTSAVAMGISTFISIYEAERLEQSIRLRVMERAMLTSLEGTDIHKMSRLSVALIALVNFCAPLIAGIVALAPFLLLPASDLVTAAWVAVGLALATLFVMGAIIGKWGEKNPLVQGARMTVVGIFAFIVCYLLGSVV